MRQISVQELYRKLNSGEDILLIDVREPWEHESFHIGGELLSLEAIMAEPAMLSRHNMVVLYCQKGIRSQIAIQRLEQKLGITNLCNLEGGMDAWKKAGL